ncbi:uncharacterized protein FIBRA_06615 [Fibroporia radiculosa]|uniref:Uncharacterized protein n=1 Tax=Fibroporia radiculosa TaxID=599839 RepID=J4GT30_9APHY|nr:uncharacterized protein FIBRA_06615 [Fibroporia radiculosa]CCM04435.1 predicted protein [Fibroporia radiculosa]
MSTRVDSPAPPTVPAGQSDARFDTSVAWAQAEASTNKLSREIGQNAAQIQAAAGQAADEAQRHEPQVISAVNQLEAGRAVSEKTTQATSQGMFDVENAKATAASAVEQAKNMANNAYQSAQSLFNNPQSSDTSTMGNVSSTVQSTASSAFQTGKEYLASAQSAVQPHIEKAKDMMAGSPGSTQQPSAPAASTAPLESGNQVVENPYPATTTGQTTRVGEI